MISVTVQEMEKNFDKYFEIAQKEPIEITDENSDNVVMALPIGEG